MDRQAGRGLVTFVLILLALGTVFMVLSLTNNPSPATGATALSPTGPSATPSKATSVAAPAKSTPAPTRKPTPRPTLTPTPTGTPIILPTLPPIFPIF